MGLINWADLTGDLLNLILSKLFGKDRHSFSLVCKPWNAVAANSPYRYSPCLMNYHHATLTWGFYQYNNFFDMSFPEMENAKLWCSKYGWLLMSVNHHYNLFFFDPSNNRKIDLPCNPPFVFQLLCFFSPPTSPECVVVGTTVIGGGIAVGTHKRGEDKWQTIDCYNSDPAGPFLLSNGALVLHCGLIYIMSTKGDVAILDIKQQRLDFKFKCLSLEVESDVDIKEHHLVKVNGEDSLFGVFVFGDERKVHVYRLSSDVKWDLVEDGIGDKVLYLSHFSSFGDKAPTKSMENSIYFPMFHDDVAVFYSLRDNKYYSIDGNCLEGNVCGPKRLELAAWITPIPAQEVNTSLSWALG